VITAQLTTRDTAVPFGAPFNPLLAAMRRSQHLTRTEDIQAWLRAEARQLIPHGAMLVAWGDFGNGDVNTRRFVHEPTWCPGSLSRRTPEQAQATMQTLRRLHGAWLDAQGEPVILALDAESGRNLVAPGLATAPNWPVSHGLTHALVHGVVDRRSDYDCLYVFLGGSALALEPNREATEVLVPCLETALRRADGGLAPAGGMPTGRPLSQREREIVRWVQEGKTNEEIGLIVGISACTVKNHLQRIFKKLNVSNRAQAAIKCRHLMVAERVN